VPKPGRSRAWTHIHSSMYCWKDRNQWVSNAPDPNGRMMESSGEWVLLDETVHAGKRLVHLPFFRIGTRVLSMSNQRKPQALFQVRFTRCYRLLHFIACCVLGGAERAEEVIERCRLRASLTAPRFEYEGAFRSWLLRVLIDEAVLVLPRSQEEAGGHDIEWERRDSSPQSPAR
jgi:hypothetical protein